METNELKKLIGRVCLVKDPRSRKNEFELAEINSVNVSMVKYSRSEEIHEHVSYGVTLKKLTITKRNRYGEVYEYHRSFNVSGDRISI